MYNGIGLETARGSGTNGYVQRNLSFIRRHKDNVDYKSEEELKKLDSQLNRGPSHEILDHERKRKVELKCMEMQELMEEQGYSEEEINRKVSVYRQMLMDNLQNSASNSGSVVEKDDIGRPIAKETHQIAEASQARNDQLRAAFGLSEFYKDGSSLDPQRKAKEQAAEALAAAQKKYAMVVDESSSSSSSSSSPSPSPERKKKRKEKGKVDKSGSGKSRRRQRDGESSAVEKKKKKKKRRSSSSAGDEAASSEAHRQLESLSSAEKTRGHSESPERRQTTCAAEQKIHRRHDRSRDERSRDEKSRDEVWEKSRQEQTKMTTEPRRRHRRPHSRSGSVDDGPTQTQTQSDRQTELKTQRQQEKRSRDTATEVRQMTHVHSRSPHHKHRSSSHSPPAEKKKRQDSRRHDSGTVEKHSHQSSSTLSAVSSRKHRKRRERDELDSVD